MKRLIPILACVTAFATTARAEKIVTPPMGQLTIDVPARADALLCAPLHRSPVFSGRVSAVDGATLDLALGDLGPAWESGQFAPGDDGQPRYYALLESGLFEGLSLPIADNGATTIALDLDAGTAQAADLVGDAIKIVPYWTLDTFFGEQAGFVGASRIDGSDAVEQARFFPSAAGRNKQADRVFFYYGGDDFGGPGWRLLGGDPEQAMGGAPLFPDEAFVFRNLRQTPMELALAGHVQLAASTVAMSAYRSVNDVFLGHTAATPVSLNESRLYESGSFKGALSIAGIDGDLLLLFDNGSAGFDKASAQTYYYYAGAAFGGPGWRRRGSSFMMKFDEAEVLQPGAGFVIRKAAAAEEGGALWSFLPEYLEN